MNSVARLGLSMLKSGESGAGCSDRQNMVAMRAMSELNREGIHWAWSLHRAWDISRAEPKF